MILNFVNIKQKYFPLYIEIFDIVTVACYMT